MKNLSDIRSKKLPLSVSLEINNVCNAKCTFCAYGKNDPDVIPLYDTPIIDKRPKQHLSKDVLKHVIKLCNSNGSGFLKKMSITPTLGEVTVSKNWLDLVREVKQSKGVRYTSSYTNAINLHRFGSQAIIDSGLDVLEISTSLVDRESYKRIYGRDKYDQVLANITDLISLNKDLGYPMDIYLNLRIDLPEEVFFKSEVYKTLVKYMDKRKISFLKKYDNYGGVILPKDLPKGATMVSREINLGKPPCYQLYRQLMVNVDGTIQACTCRTDESLMTRNILEYSTLEAAWKNDKLEKIRNDWEKGVLPNACVTCTHYGSYKKIYNYYKIYPRFKSYVISSIRGTIVYVFFKKIFHNFGNFSESIINRDG